MGDVDVSAGAFYTAANLAPGLAMALSLLLVSPALAADLQGLAEAEWARSAPSELVATAPDSPEGRAALARALGRLRVAEALPELIAHKDDPDPRVRLAVAEALAWTPGAAPAIRAWLDETSPEPSPPGRPRLPAVPGVRPVLLASLGFHADGADVPRLVAALDEAPAAAAAAAISLGRLGRARVVEAADAVPALIAASKRLDPAVAEASAFALFRIGLDAAGPEEVSAVAAAWADLPTGSARAWALRVAWPRLAPERRAAVAPVALADPAPVVRVAVLDVAQPGDLDPLVVGRLLAERDRGVATAALGALGRLGGDEASTMLRAVRDGDDPWAAGAALAALAGLGEAPDERWLAPDRPEAVRAAAAGALTDPARLEALALGDRHAAVRTAAIGALLDRAEAPDPEAVRRLLAATDESVREGAAALAAQHGLDAPAAERPPWRLPDGVSGDLADARRVRGAVVHTTEGAFRVEFYPDVAPLAVASFAALADRDFFDGLVFHRFVPGFVVQGGDPRGDGWGGPGYELPDEVSALPYDVGALGMARADRDTGGSQWFVTLTPQPHLVGDYTLFGRVVSGLPVVRRLERGDRVLDVSIERSR